MDLTDLWQQHKKFILAIAAALLLLLIGRGVLQAEYPVDDVRNIAHATQRMKLAQPFVGRRIVSGSFDDAERDRVDPDAARRIFDRERSGHGRQPSLRQRRKR